MEFSVRYQHKKNKFSHSFYTGRSCSFFYFRCDNRGPDGRDVQAGLTDRMVYQRHAADSLYFLYVVFGSICKTFPSFQHIQSLSGYCLIWKKKCCWILHVCYFLTRTQHRTRRGIMKFTPYPFRCVPWLIKQYATLAVDSDTIRFLISNRFKRVLIPLENLFSSVSPSVHIHGTSWLPLDRLSWNLILENFTKKKLLSFSIFIYIGHV
jgi:hypothetical protein